jgi:hypothetical protein
MAAGKARRESPAYPEKIAFGSRCRHRDGHGINPDRERYGTPSQVAPLLDQIDAWIGSITADGTYDGALTYDTVAARAGDIPVLIPPHVIAVLSTAAGLHPS